MAQDISKWADHAQILTQHYASYETGLYYLKQVLDLENGANNASSSDILMRGGVLEASLYSYNSIPIQIESPARPPLERLSIFIDTAIAGLQKQVIKKFPQFGDLGKNVIAFQTNTQDLLNELSPFILLLASVEEFLSLSIPLLQVAVKFSRLNLQINPQLTNLFLDLFLGVSTVIHMLTSIGPEVKLVAFVYNKCHQIKNSGSDCPQWPKVHKILTQYDKPLPAISEALQPVASRIISIIVSIRPELERVLSPADKLREGTVLSVLPEVYLGQKSIVRPTFYNLMTLAGSNRLYKILVFGMMTACVESFQQTASLEILRSSILFGYKLQLVRNETLDIASEFESICKSNSKVSKLKTITTDVIATQKQAIHQFHKERRFYLRNELKQTSLLVSRLQSIIIDKFWTVIASVSLARDEIIWYFNHVERGESRKNKKEAPRPTDLIVIELIHYVRDIARTLAVNQDLVKYAIKNHLATWEEVTQIKESIELFAEEKNLYRDPIAFLLKDVHLNMMRLQNEDVMEMAAKGEFISLRVNIMRLQVFASLSSDLVNAQLLKNFIEPLSQVFHETLWLDCFDHCLDEATSLKTLFFYQSSIQDLIKDAFEQKAHFLRYIGNLGCISDEFVGNVYDAWPIEYNWVHAHTVCYATEFYSALGQYTGSVAFDIALKLVDLYAKTSPSETVSFMGSSTGNASPDGKKRSTMPRNEAARTVMPVIPGRESDLKGSNPETKTLDKLKASLMHLLYALTFQTSVQVEEMLFQPMEYFIDCFLNKFRIYINQTIFLKAPEGSAKDSQIPSLALQSAWDESITFEVKRPSHVLLEVKAFLAAAKYIDDLAKTDLISLVRDVLIEQSDVEKARAYTADEPDKLIQPTKSGKGSSSNIKDKSKEPTINSMQLFLVTYMNWYREFACFKGTSGLIVFSNMRDSFAKLDKKVLNATSNSNQNSPSTVESELYTDAAEIGALCRMIGPQGVQFIDLKLTRQVAILCAYIQEMVTQNLDGLERLRTSWVDDLAVKELLKKLKRKWFEKKNNVIVIMLIICCFVDTNDFLNKVTMMGFICELRNSLHRGLNQVKQMFYFGNFRKLKYNCRLSNQTIHI